MNRIRSGRSPCGNDTSQDRRDCNHQHRRHEGDRIARADLVEEVTKQPRALQRRCGPHDQADAGHDESTRQHHANQIGWLRAERHPERELTAALRDRRRHDAVEADCREHQRETAEATSIVSATRCDAVVRSICSRIVMSSDGEMPASSLWISRTSVGASAAALAVVRTCSAVVGEKC